MKSIVSKRAKGEVKQYSREQISIENKNKQKQFRKKRKNKGKEKEKTKIEMKNIINKKNHLQKLQTFFFLLSYHLRL